MNSSLSVSTDCRVSKSLLGASNLLLTLVVAFGTCLTAHAADPVPTLNIDAGKIAAKSNPMLYGLMTEEINYSYDGGLYAELIRNRTFTDRGPDLTHWSLVGDASAGSMVVDPSQPLNSALTNSLKLMVTNATAEKPTGIANEGFWGIGIHANTQYHASFYAKGDGNFSGPLMVELVSDEDGKVLTSASIPKITKTWKKYEATLKTGNVAASKNNHFRITMAKPGTVWLNLVSLFPPTYKDRPNGNRPDIMQLLADLKPSFLRFPGGNYLEGNDLANYFDWKKTIGDVSERPGHRSPWNYHSSDGMGLLEFLGWCEDLHMEPVLAVFNGYTLGRGANNSVPPGPALQPYVQDALDEIEYVTGSTSTKWGARRAKDGHRAPFKLEYVEIGNEDRSGTNYNERFAQFYDAIKKKYPQLNIIATTRVQGRTPDVLDEHFYRSSVSFEADAAHYDNRPRNTSKIFVGEWATREGQPTTDMGAALGDASWLTGMERNSDLIVMSCYAPLFVNVSDTNRNGSVQWVNNLIGYNALTSYASPSYYAQKMFALNRGDGILAVDAQNIPQQAGAVRSARGGRGGQPGMVPSLFFDATRNTAKGTIYLKLVNVSSNELPVQINVSGATVAAKGRATVLSSASLDDTNTINDPKKITPVESEADGLGASFTRTLPAYSVTVLEMNGS